MDSHTKRLTIYVPQDLSRRLAAVKENDFHGRTQSEMLRELVARGLQAREHRPAAGSDGSPSGETAGGQALGGGPSGAGSQFM